MIIRSGGLVDMVATANLEDTAVMFRILCVIFGENMKPTPAASCLRRYGLCLPLPLPLPLTGMDMCSFSFDEKYVVYPCPSVSVLVFPCLVSCSATMCVLVLSIQSLISCLLVIELIPLQLKVAMCMLDA